MTPSTDALLSAGRPVDDIHVRINYRIIELFSRGLYSSPHKALEELVANSYDALAQQVWLLLPTDLSDPRETIWVVDDGESMDLPGLHQLWRIASSNKRDHPTTGERLPIGKFGIGKLATYVLARNLTYICRRGDDVLAVTMDYGSIDPDSSTDEQDLVLHARRLSTDDLAHALAPMSTIEGGRALAELLQSPGAPSSWTVAAMSGLTPASADIKHGRVRWLMSTALPMSPGFNLTINGRNVPSSVPRRANVMTEWKVGENSELPNGVTTGVDQDGPFILIDGLEGKLRGEVALYDDVLTKGKAAERLGHSHGFFVKVRGRLVNVDDPLFGLPALSHSTFNRFHLEVEADGLDAFLASTRESVMRRGPVELFQEWLKAEFNTARKIYDSWAARRQTDKGASGRVGSSSASLSRRPLVAAVRALLAGEISSLALVSVPLDLDAQSRHLLITDLEASLVSPEGPIKDVLIEPMGVDHYIAAYDPLRRIVKVNSLHPFFASFVQTSSSHEAFEMVAVAEVLTEAYVFEATADAELANSIVAKRDSFLRELVMSQTEGPASIAQFLLDQRQNPAGLAEAVADALRSLGFQVAPVTSGAADGVAVTGLGSRDGGRLGSYGLIYEVRASPSGPISLADSKVTRLGEARQTSNMEYALLVAPRFRDLTDRSSRFGQALTDAGVTAVCVDDLALLVQVAAVRQLGYSRLRDWLDSCRTADESRAWVLAEAARPRSEPVLRDLLDTIAHLQTTGSDPVEVPAVVALMQTKGHTAVTRVRVVELIRSLQSLAPGFVSFDGRVVTLENALDRIVAELRAKSLELAPSIRDRARLDPLLVEDSR